MSSEDTPMHCHVCGQAYFDGFPVEDCYFCHKVVCRNCSSEFNTEGDLICKQCQEDKDGKDVQSR